VNYSAIVYFPDSCLYLETEKNEHIDLVVEKEEKKVGKGLSRKEYMNLDLIE